MSRAEQYHRKSTVKFNEIVPKELVPWIWWENGICSMQDEVAEWAADAEERGLVGLGGRIRDPLESPLSDLCFDSDTAGRSPCLAMRSVALAASTLTEEQWEMVVLAFDRRCAYCGNPGEKLTVDHVVAITRGGKDEIGNVIPACWPCNISKYNHGQDEWLRGKGPTFEAEAKARIRAGLKMLHGLVPWTGGSDDGEVFQRAAVNGR